MAKSYCADSDSATVRELEKLTSNHAAFSKYSYDEQQDTIKVLQAARKRLKKSEKPKKEYSVAEKKSFHNGVKRGYFRMAKKAGAYKAKKK